MTTITKRILSLVLCFVMLTGIMPVSALANDNVEEAKTTEESSVVAYGTDGASEEWTLSGCDCGSEETALAEHGEACAQKVSLEELCEETAEDIFAQWEALPEECQKYILEYLSEDEAYAETLEELYGYVNPVAAVSDEDAVKFDKTETQIAETENDTNEAEGQTEETEDPTQGTEGTTEPEDTTPEDTTPEGTTPEGTTPEGTTPEGTTPEGTTPEGTTPEGTTPEGTTPEGTTPEGTTPEGTTPEGTTPEETESDEIVVDVEETVTEEAVSGEPYTRDGETPLAIVYAASDFQPKGEELDNSETVMKAIIDAMQAAEYTAVNGALLAGDYSNVGDTWNKDKGEVNAEVYNDKGVQRIADVLEEQWGLKPNLNKLGNLMTGTSNAGDNVVFVQGNHDPADTKGLDQFGANDAEHYGVFVIHEDNFQWAQSAASTSSGNSTAAETTAKATAEALRTYLQGKVDSKDNRPVFVVSHVPLHFGWRTAEKNGDNMYAKYIFDVLNEYGKELNIIFLFGHNHSSTYDDYLGGGAIYLPAGHQIRIPNKGSTTASTAYTLTFTYMNAGYLGYYGGAAKDSDGDKDTGLSSTVFEIYDDKVYVSRFDENGEDNLKNAGVKDSSHDNWDGAYADTSVYASDQVIKRKPFTEELSSSVKDSGVMTVGKTAEVSVSGLYGKTYNVAWSTSDADIVEVAASSSNPMTATINAKDTGKVTITANITVATESRAVGDTKTLTMDLEVMDLEMVTLAPAGENTFFVLDDNQDGNSWTADTTKNYVLVSQEKGNPAAGEFMAMYANGQADPAEGDNVGAAAWREINAEPITVMPLPINGETQYALVTDDDYYQWQFIAKSRGDSYNWYVVQPKNTTYALMLSKAHTETNLQNYDPDNDGVRLRGAADVISADTPPYSSIWRTSSRGVGLTTRPVESGYYFAPYYDSIQGDISVFYTEGSDVNMGQRIYMYEETTVTLENPILAYMTDLDGSVSKGVGPDAGIGEVIYIQNGDVTEEVPVTVGMLSGDGLNTAAAGTYTGLTVTYAGKVITEDFTLTVTEATTLLKNEGGKFRSTIYRLVEEMVGGRHYLVVDNNEAGEAHAMGATSRGSNTAQEIPVSAHNVLIQPFTVGGENGLYIDSTRYSDEPDNPQDSIIENQGDINANIFSDDHKAAIRLVWTPSILHTTPNSGDKKFTNVYSNDENYHLLISEYEDGRLWIMNSYTTKYADKPVLYWGGETTAFEQWKYVPTSNSNDRTVRATEGLVLDSTKATSATSGVTAYRLFYNFETHRTGTTAYWNKNFITSENSTANYSPLHRRTWIYEQDDSIDTITARLNDLTGRVTVDCTAAAHTGDYILVETYGTDGSLETVSVPLRVSMLSGGSLNTKAAGTYSGLTVTYQGKVISTNYTLVVAAPVTDNYPEFPDEGAVKIDKQLDTTQYNYLDTGAAVINLSVTGIPAQSGVDILFMLDTSSSMYECIHGNDVDACSTCSKSRLDLLKETVVQTLKDLQAPINGYSPDIDVAVACFNGYTPIDGSIQLDYTKATSNDITEAGGSLSDVNSPQLQKYRQDSSNISLNFTDVSRLTASSMQAAADGLYLNAGTNYDRAMELSYSMLKEKQEKNAINGETRQQILVFMSDGAPYQFNYAHGNSRLAAWNDWLLGNSVYAPPADSGANALFAAYRNTEGKLWMAEAIKGDTNVKHKIINPDLQNSNTKVDYVYGLGATIYSVGMGITSDRLVEAATCNQVLQNIASPTTADHKYYYECTEPSDFTNAFSEISQSVRTAGDAVFTDQMGEYFDLITYNKKTVEHDEEPDKTIDYGTPKIELKQYELYYRSEIGTTVNGVKVTEAMAGSRKPVDPTVLETITFNDDGTAAYSDKIGATTNILKDGIICAQTFWYNTNASNVLIDVDGDGTAETTLESECFYWNVGDIPQDELVLSYPVYLNASMEGDRPAGTYDTNKHAELNYVNYLGNNCELEVASPKLPWEQATVGYAFYLVDQNGNPIINQTTGQTGSFEHSVKLTEVVYKDFLLNANATDIVAETVMAGAVLPDGYRLFDADAEYEVMLESGGAGYYEIIKGDAAAAETTYVQGIQPTAFKTTGRYETEDYITANTIVWFAVTATVQCAPDTIVIDYGLPVEADVLANDVMIGYNGTLKYIGEPSVFEDGYTAAKVQNPELKFWEYLQNQAAINTAKFNTSSLDGDYGKIEVVDKTSNVRYTLNTSNGMQMDKEETFVYAVDYKGEVGTQGYYYSTVTVIPATSIYYEDGFVTYKVKNFSDDTLNTDADKQWSTEGEAANQNQAQDRPGEFSLSTIDANNIYGYDGAYTNMATYSLGSAKKVTVNKDIYAEAQFTFSGTGFDVISMTSNDTGTIVVSVYDADDFAQNNYNAQIVKSQMVDTYYGYKYVKCDVTYEYLYDTGTSKFFWDKNVGSETDKDAVAPVYPASPKSGDTVTSVEYCWIADQDASASLYQVPVAKISGLDYGKYTAVISASYKSGLDHNTKDASYDFYLDAIRIYDPANDGKDNDTIKDAYVADGEGWPEYFELRNLIIKKNDFDAMTVGDQINGAIFIDNTKDTNYSETYSITDYTNYGPNNELYLAPGQAVAFELNVTDTNLDQIHMAMKSVGEKSASVKYYDAGSKKAEDVSPVTIATATDLYYDITSLNGKTVVIQNSGSSDDAILSITNVKVTYKSEHTDSIENSYFQVTQQSADAAVASLMTLRAPVVPEQPEQPDVPEVEQDMFEPKRFDVRLSKNSVKVGQKVTVTVTTGRDVNYVTINGDKVANYKGSRFSSTRTWEMQVKAEEAGELDVTVVCYNHENQASKPVVKTVTVASKNQPNAFQPERFDVRLSDNSVKVGSKVTVTVTTGKDVEYITVNGSKVTSYSGSRFSNTRTWKVRVNAKEVGEMNVSVVCYNRANQASAAVVRTVTVTQKYTNINNAMNNIFTGIFGRYWGSR